MGILTTFLLIIIFIFIGFPLVIILIVKHFKRAKELKEKLKNQEIPERLKRKLEKKFKDYKPAQITTFDLIKNIGLYKQAGVVVKTKGLSVKRTCLIYPTLSWANLTNFKESLLKLYMIISVSGFNPLDVNNWTQYTYSKIKEGYLETFFINQVLTIKLNNQMLGSFNFKTKEIRDYKNQKQGSFDCPSFLKIRSIGGFDFDWVIKVFRGNKKLADVIANSSELRKLKQFGEAVKSGQTVDINMFKNINTKNKWDAQMLLGLGLAMHYLFMQ